ncbi:uncharacterized protein LOC130433884 isoform X1 [Triplophysa dalaica]|uniref:uncharacterized protein LOC130433884 isoform X1 n=1 Tax=Triplophysa dalaica TaxID=1582913 RepID=UPI0024DFCED0|nr:uncharacterized protein LOC130433884 isoform X1 [Triplophysa dalaica]
MMQFCADKVLLLNILTIISVVKCGTNEILTFTAHEGGKVEIHCPYESGYETYEKYLCRGKCSILFSKDIPVKSESKPDDGRFSLTDNSAAHIFTVTITDLRSSDEGMYWCGIKTVIGLKDKYKEVHLKITQAGSFFGSQVPLYFGPTPHISEALLTAVSGEITSESTSHKPTTASFHTTPPVSTDSSSRPATSSPPSPTSSTSSSSSHSLSSNTETSLGLFGFITLSVTGMLILFGFVLFFYFTRRKKNEQLQLSGDSAGNLKNGAVRQTMVSDCDYEEIHLPNVHPDYSLVLPSSGEHDASVYALAQNVSSNNLHYSTIKFTELSHRTSDGQTSCDYATVVL